MTDCWRIASNNRVNITGFGDRPCGNTVGENAFVQCCRQEDVCLEDGICHFTRAPDEGTSGYYVGGCTDESGNDNACLQACNGHKVSDIVYSGADALWHCCGTNEGGDTDCSAPTNETFQAPAPEKLTDYASPTTLSTATTGPAASSSSPLIAQSSSTAHNATAIPTSSPATSYPGLSSGTKAGIGVGVVLGVACIVMLTLILILIRKRRRPWRTVPANTKGGQKSAQQRDGSIGESRQQEEERNWHELQGQDVKSELDPSRGAFHEMGMDGSGAGKGNER